ncbi:hypothetical protein [Actinocorallia longicatena]|uniref:Uncharacterized protein n=1 Tax=Actinocorallia longicatena TaxID=111803 RepID=A0ABP6QBX5_9ACTN
MYRLPFIDRFAHELMWHRGAWEVWPPDLIDPAPGPGPDGIGAPLPVLPPDGGAGAVQAAMPPPE